MNAREIVARDDGIIAELTARFPDKRVPHGGLTDAAKELGMKIYIVRRAAASAGFVIVPKPADASPRINTPRVWPIEGTTPWKIVNEVRRMYPCQEVPLGTFTALAEKYGVTRERVRQVLKRDGYSVFVQPDKGPRKCAECQSEAISQHHKYCIEHNTVPLSCAECGEIFRRKRNSAIHQEARRGEAGPFCNKVCQGRWFGKEHGWGVHQAKRKAKP